MKLLTERFEQFIDGIPGCFDRILITGTLPNICYPQGMAAWLYGQTGQHRHLSWSKAAR